MGELQSRLQQIQEDSSTEDSGHIGQDSAETHSERATGGQTTTNKIQPTAGGGRACLRPEDTDPMEMRNCFLYGGEWRVISTPEPNVEVKLVSIKPYNESIACPEEENTSRPSEPKDEAGIGRGAIEEFEIKPTNALGASVEGKSCTQEGVLQEPAKSEKTEHVEAAPASTDSCERSSESNQHEEAEVEYAESLESGISSIDGQVDYRQQFLREADTGHMADNEWEDGVHDERLAEPVTDHEWRHAAVNVSEGVVVDGIQQGSGGVDLSDVPWFLPQKPVRTQLLVHKPIEDYIPYSKYVHGKENLPEIQGNSLSNKRFMLEILNCRVIGHLVASEESGVESATVGEEETLSDTEICPDSTKSKIPSITIEDYGAKNDRSDESMDSPAADNRGFSQENSANERDVIEGLITVPQDSQLAGTNTIKLSAIPDDSSTVGETTTEQDPGSGAAYDQISSTTDCSSAAPDITTGRSSTNDAEAFSQDSTRANPESTPCVCEAPDEGGDSVKDTSASLAEEARPRVSQPVMDACIVKKSPFACPQEELVCEDCGEFFTLPEHLQAHSVCHPPTISYTHCAGCGANFKRTTELKRHRDHQRERLGVRCARCRQWFPVCDDLYRHHQARKYQLDGKKSILAPFYFVVKPRK